LCGAAIEELTFAVAPSHPYSSSAFFNLSDFTKVDPISFPNFHLPPSFL
jgi:hypothetical protein